MVLALSGSDPHVAIRTSIKFFYHNFDRNYYPPSNMFGAIGMRPLLVVWTRGSGAGEGAPQPRRPGAFISLDVRWVVKTKGFVGLDIGWRVRRHGFVDLGVCGSVRRTLAGLTPSRELLGKFEIIPQNKMKCIDSGPLFPGTKQVHKHKFMNQINKLENCFCFFK